MHLSHSINGRVIRDLGLEDNSQKYSLDFNQPERAQQKFDPAAPWFDIPPHAWTSEDTTETLVKKFFWTDPTDDEKIKTQLLDKVVQPIFNSSFGRPPKSSAYCGILKGPPGTRKTSLVNSLSAALKWPMISVPASVILAHGWDQMEARAQVVFRRLGYLNRCVVFFDEFEEFFREREDNTERVSRSESGAGNGNVSDVASRLEAGARNGVAKPAPDNRTIAAFITSAMLPRLQDLHDSRHCVVLLATNNADKLDEAVRRAGRFDFQVMIGHPSFLRAASYAKTPGRTGEELGKIWVDNKKAITKAVTSALKLVKKEREAEAKKERTGFKDEMPFKAVENALLRVAGAVAPGVDGSNLISIAKAALLGGSVMECPKLEDL